MNTYETKSGIISALDIEKKLQQLNQQQAEPGSEHSVSAETMYGAELPLYFLYTAVDGSEGVKQTHARLLDLVLNNDDPGKPYMTGDIAVPLDLENLYVVMSGVRVCVIQAETPDEEQHHALAFRDEIEKVYTILYETNQAGKEVTIKFHSLQDAMVSPQDVSLDMEKGDDHVAG